MRLLSQTSEYALRSMAWLARNEGHAQTTQEIAESTKVPRGYLSKVLHLLSRSGLVVGQRGLGGGFTLARPPAEINALDVVNAVEAITPVNVCPLHPDDQGRACPIHGRLLEAVGYVESVLAGVTLAEFTSGGPDHLKEDAR